MTAYVMLISVFSSDVCASCLAIAPSRRCYAGGGGSVRGYGYQDIGPRDPNNDPIGGRSLTEFSIEARVKAFGNFGVVPFLDAGNIYTSPLPKFSDLRFGTGLGVRYYSNFGPIRSEEHTSELQSLMRISYAVFCLKKKPKQTTPTQRHTHPTPRTTLSQPTHTNKT